MCACDRHWSRDATCTCSCPSHAGLRPRHRANRAVGACSFACGPHEHGATCVTYVGRHRAEAS